MYLDHLQLKINYLFDKCKKKMINNDMIIYLWIKMQWKKSFLICHFLRWRKNHFWNFSEPRWHPCQKKRLRWTHPVRPLQIVPIGEIVRIICAIVLLAITGLIAKSVISFFKKNLNIQIAIVNTRWLGMQFDIFIVEYLQFLVLWLFWGWYILRYFKYVTYPSNFNHI